MVLDQKSLVFIVNGAAFLGSGGGGQISTGLDFISEISLNGGGVELLTFPLPEEINDDLCCILCDIGSISSIDQNQVGAIQTSFEILSEHFKELGPIKAVFPIETGPENSLVPFVIASKNGLSVIDGDGAGRAVPTLPLSSFSALGSISHWRPISIANGLGASMLVNSHAVNEFDSILRDVAGTKQFFNSASLALWPEKVRDQARKCIPGAISRSLFIGQILEGISTGNESLIKEALPVVNQLSGYLIGMGKVLSKHEEEGRGFLFTKIRIANELNRDIITVVAKNENLIAFSNEQFPPLAVAPDSICYLTTEFDPLTNVEIKEGQMIFLIGVIADQKLLHPEILAGFRGILLELGFVGKLNIEPTHVEKLGELFLRLISVRKD